MGSNAVFFAWNRSIPGREKLSGAHFGEFVEYLEGCRSSGAIESFEPVLLDQHGGDLNGFFVVRGDVAQIDSLVASADWQAHMVRASMHLDGSGAVRARTGQAVIERMDLWKSMIPR